MQEILDLKVSGRSGLVTPASHGAKLVSADYHGAELEVVRSQCASRVGVKGIVVRDTKFTFVVVTEKDEVKSELNGPLEDQWGMRKLTFCFTAIPKEHTVFRFTVPQPSAVEAEAEGKGDNQEKSTPEGPKSLVFELHGSQFENRPVDRANKKFKWRNIDYV
jgi:ribonuclease P protein subunit POP4